MSDEALTPKEILDHAKPDGVYKTSVPDPTRTPHGQCSVCHKLVCSEAEVGKPCPYTNKKTNRRCFGTIEKYVEDPDVVNIDGDKVIAFIMAIENLGSILRELNVVGVADAWRVGKQVGAINSIIEQEKSWKDVLRGIAEDLKKNGAIVAAGQIELKQMIHLVERSNSPSVTAGIKTLRELSEVLGELAKHRESGLLDIVAGLGKEPPQ